MSGYPGYNAGRYGPPQPQYQGNGNNYYPYDSLFMIAQFFDHRHSRALMVIDSSTPGYFDHLGTFQLTTRSQQPATQLRRRRRRLPARSAFSSALRRRRLPAASPPTLRVSPGEQLPRRSHDQTIVSCPHAPLMLHLDLALTLCEQQPPQPPQQGYGQYPAPQPNFQNRPGPPPQPGYGSRQGTLRDKPLV